MMKLDYGSLLSPEPIKLSIGTIRIPILREISKLTFLKFNTFQIFLKMSPEDYYTKLNINKSVIWEHMTDDEKKSLTLYDIVTHDEDACNIYTELFDFFFVEKVIYKDGIFFVLNKSDDTDSNIEITPEILRGVIHEDTFYTMLDILRQVCCLKNDDILKEKDVKFKNEKARLLWERMQEAAKENEKKTRGKNNANLSIPNIISSVAAKSTNLNINSIWDITIFQLYDQFNRLQNNDIHNINSMRLAAWGDEKKTFDYALWYKNMFDKIQE